MILALVLLISSTAISIQQAATAPKPIIPPGMPVRLDIVPDPDEPGGSKYLIKQVASDDARRTGIIIIPIKKNGKLKVNDDSLLRIIITKRHPGKVNAEGPDVAKLIVLVEWFEDSSGKWVLDSSDPKKFIEAVVKYGTRGLPKVISPAGKRQ